MSGLSIVDVAPRTLSLEVLFSSSQPHVQTLDFGPEEAVVDGAAVEDRCHHVVDARRVGDDVVVEVILDGTRKLSSPR